MHLQQNQNCHESIMRRIDTELRLINPYVEFYRRLHEAASNAERQVQAEGAGPIDIELRLIRDPRDDQRRYNAPVSNRECMYLIESRDGEVPVIDLAVHPHGRVGCTRINSFSRHVDPMVFTLLFPSGDAGWCINADNAIPDQRKRPTPLEFYASRIAVRGHFNPIHHGGKLYQQYLVHAYCTVEAQRLFYIKKHQNEFRVECYQGLIDFLAHAAHEENLRPGNLVILPSSFVGSPRPTYRCSEEFER